MQIRGISIKQLNRVSVVYWSRRCKSHLAELTVSPTGQHRVNVAFKFAAFIGSESQFESGSASLARCDLRVKCRAHVW